LCKITVGKLSIKFVGAAAIKVCAPAEIDPCAAPGVNAAIAAFVAVVAPFQISFSTVCEIAGVICCNTALSNSFETVLKAHLAIERSKRVSSKEL
jgi:hypothetical protein